MNYYPMRRPSEREGQSERARARLALRRRTQRPRDNTARVPLPRRQAETPPPTPPRRRLQIQPWVGRIAGAIGRTNMLRDAVDQWYIAVTREGEVNTDPDLTLPRPAAPPGTSWLQWGVLESYCTTVPGTVWSGVNTNNCSAPRGPEPGPTVTHTPLSGGQTMIRWDRLGRPDPLSYMRFRQRYIWRLLNPAGLPLETLFPNGLPMVRPSTPPVYNWVNPNLINPRINRLGEQGHGLAQPRTATGRPARRPPARTKEVKAALTIRGTIVDRIMGTVTESLDMLNCAHSALPFRYQAKGRYDPGRYGGQGGWRRYTPQRQAHHVYTHWDKIDVGAFIQCVIENQVEDYLIGRLGQLTAKANRRRGAFAGSAFGPAL